MNLKSIRITFVLIIGLFTVSACFGQTTAAELNKLGNDQIKQRNYPAAVASFTECIRLNQNAYGCYANRAIALTETSRNQPMTADDVMKYDGVNVINPTRQKALADINFSLAQYPKNAGYLFVRAQIYSLEELYGKALEDYKQGLASDLNLATTNPVLYKAVQAEIPKLEKQYASSLGTKGREAAIRASYLKELKDLPGAQKVNQEAIDSFTKSLELDKTNYINWASRGDTYRYNKNYDLAIADYTQTILLKPDYTDGYVHRAECYLEQNKTALALADYEKVLALPVNDETKYGINDSYLGRGHIRLLSGQTDTAIADFDKVLSENPEYVAALFYRGQAYAKKGNKVQALADFKKALEIAPEYAEAKAEIEKLSKAKPTIGKPIASKRKS